MTFDGLLAPFQLLWLTIDNSERRPTETANHIISLEFGFSAVQIATISKAKTRFKIQSWVIVISMFSRHLFLFPSQNYGPSSSMFLVLSLYSPSFSPNLRISYWRSPSYASLASLVTNSMIIWQVWVHLKMSKLFTDTGWLFQFEDEWLNVKPGWDWDGCLFRCSLPPSPSTHAPPTAFDENLPSFQSRAIPTRGLWSFIRDSSGFGWISWDEPIA